MGRIEEREGKFRVQIRKKGINIYTTFSKKETAELFVRYKEDLIDEMTAFEVPKEKLVTFSDAIEIKYNELVERKCDSHTLLDIQRCGIMFSEWKDLYLSDITYDMILEKAKAMSKEIVRQGGSGKDKGAARIQSPVTILRKIRYLSAIFSLMVEKGFMKSNPALPVSQYLSNLNRKQDEN